MKSSYRKYFAVMILCFVVGGFAITSYFIQAYTNIWNQDFLGPRLRQNSTNFTEVRPREIATPLNREAVLFSPVALIMLMSGIVLLAGGISVWSLTREKEFKQAKDRITHMLLLPEERMVLNELSKAGGEITQSQLVVKTSLSKVKVHRIVKGLEQKGVVRKFQYGLTNKIILEKEV